MIATVSIQEQIENNLNDVLSHLSKGQFIDAMQKYLHENVTLTEANGTPKKGKAYCIAKEEELLATVSEFIRYEVISGPAVKGDTSFYESVMEFITNDGVKHTFEQVVRTKWKDGQIIDERFYHV